MAYLLHLSSMLTFATLIACFETPNCSISLVPKGSSCYCDSLDNANGWSYTCVDLDVNHYSAVKTFFSVEFIVDHSIKLQCGEDEVQYHSIFHELDLDKIQTFVFSSCPLPNSSYSEIIPYREDYPVEQIKIESKRDEAIFTYEVFGNLSTTLKSLILSGNKIKTFPESFLSNFTNLKYLALADNKIATLPEKVFHSMKNLIILEIPNNNLESLPENVFQNLIALEKLYLYKNKLKGLNPNIFKNLRSLSVLDLADNHLMILPDHVFTHLSNLINLRLRANWLMTIPDILFSNCSSLKAIDLSLNRLMEPLSGGLLEGLYQLENITISNCNISELPSDFFSYCPNITNINIDRNSLTTLPENIFQNNTVLKMLNINFNSLNELSTDLFPNQLKLEKFSLFKNNLSSVPDGFFKRTPRIKTLILGGNRLTNASQSIFRDLPNLEVLDLSSNNLSYFRLDTKNEVIKSIDLSYNNLRELPKIQWTRHLRLEMLNFDHNKIEYLSIPILYPSTRRTPVLNFASNNIKTISTEDASHNDDFIQRLPAQDIENYVETILILNSNPFVCDCQMYNFYKYIKHSIQTHKTSIRFDKLQSLICQQPARLSDKPITSISSSQFTCELREHCIYPCHCYTRAVDSKNIVNCSGHGLKELPNMVPQNTNILIFHDNQLTGMSGFQKRMWDNLTELHLENNEIKSLKQWRVPLKLKNISLAGNQISNLPLPVMNHISSSPEFQITLSDNPWMCNCSTISFKKWLSEYYQFIPDVKKIMCANRLKWNDTLNHTAIFTTSDDILCPLSDWPNKLHLITVTTICVILALLLFIISILYYRNKQTIIAYVYIHMHNVFVCFFNEEDMDEEKIFDAFVSYSNSDRDVALALLEELEEKDQRFRLCIHERNWIAGNQISWNIFNSVHNSKRTILVISKEFLESMWFQVEFHTAYYQMLEDKIDRLIIIVKGELPPKESLDKDLQFLLSTKTYLIWEEKWFWEKLKYAMPHKKEQSLPSDVLALKDRPSGNKIKPVENQIAILSGNLNKSTEKIIVNEQIRANSTMNLVKIDPRS